VRRYFIILLLLFVAGCTRAESVVPLDNSAQVCFTPGADCTGLIVEKIGGARSEILVQAYSFTSQPIAQALVKASKRGVSVIVILDKSNKVDRGYSAASFLANSGVPTFIDFDHKIAHNKIMIIDNTQVITGSFNFTKAAQQSNAENVLILNNQLLTKEYKDNFKSHLRHSEQIQGNY
jgi:phosphatidylserine/phosphatidylglycerophosphate/cardiolipin synthase-like enzyme